MKSWQFWAAFIGLSFLTSRRRHYRFTVHRSSEPHACAVDGCGAESHKRVCGIWLCNSCLKRRDIAEYPEGSGRRNPRRRFRRRRHPQSAALAIENRMN